jgi:predicted RNA binding protein YcfA (HicA-like mRNA interferase family)
MGVKKNIEKLLANPVDMQIEKVINIMYFLDYEISNIKGSHYHFTHPTLSTIIIPAHNGKVKKWYLRDIKSLLAQSAVI